MYILPLYGGSWRNFKAVEQTYLFNNISENSLIIECTEDILELDNSSNLLKKFEYQDKLFYCVSIPTAFKDCLEMVEQSKYSMINEKCKQKIISFHGLVKGSKFRKILYREESYYKQLEEELDTSISRLAEIGSLLIVEEETIEFDLSNLQDRGKFTKIEW